MNPMWPRVEALMARGAKDERVAGDFSMWVFVLGDLVIFAVYFFVFMVYRFHDPDLFRESQRHLNVGIAAVNTIVLLTSSQLVARSVHAARAADHRGVQRLIKQAMGLGVLFSVLKLVEWAIETSRGHTFPSNDFFMFYFAFTGVHLLHVLLGLVILGVVLHELREPATSRVSVVEAGATYWHMVDVVWVLLFAIVYLLR